MGQPTVTRWATLANYPAGANPWNSQPLKVAPAQFYFTPDIPLPAENMNYELNALGGIQQSAVQAVSAAAVANWGAPIANIDPSNVGGTTVTTACWDSYHEQWIAYGYDFGTGSSGDQAYTTYDGGKTWHQISGLSIGILSNVFGLGVCVNPANGQFVVVRAAVPAATLSATVGNQISGTTTTSITGHAEAGALLMDPVNTNHMTFVGATGVAGPYTGLGLSFDGVTTWTDITSSLPTGWQSGTSNVMNFLGVSGPTGNVWALQGQRPGTDSSLLMLQTNVFGDITPTFLSSGTTREIRGLAYDFVQSLWGVLTQDNSSPPNVELWTTPDPISGASTWTKAHQFTGYWGGGLCVVGNVWAVYLQDITNHGLGNQVLWSPNVVPSSTTSTPWSRADYFDSLSMSARGDYDPVAMLSNGSQGLIAVIFDTPANPIALSLKSGWQPDATNVF